ncbi:GIP, partial [Symbiodinium sp. CCMP2592]
MLVNRGGQEHLTTTRLPAAIDRKTLLGDLIWVSSSGQVRDGEVARDHGVDLGMLTVEEREQGQHAEQGLPFVAHVCADSHFEEEPASTIPAVQEKPVKGGERGDRYKILSYEAEQEMNRAEVKVAQLVTDTIDARILSDPRTPADEKLKWVNEAEGLRSDEAEVWPGAKILPAKVMLTKKPLQDDTEVDPTDPLSTWRAKARIVVCGNYEQNTFGHDPDNASANPAIEHIRWSAACLADNPGWTGLVLDITAAFLNARMDNETTFVRPPKVLMREGLVPPSKVWRSWTFKNAEGVMFVLDPISSGVWAIRKQVEPQSFCGIFDMYVDDGLIVGPVGLCTGLAEVLLTTWQMKIQGFLPSDELKDGEKVMIGDKQVAVREELQFLGMVIKRTKDGVALHLGGYRVGAAGLDDGWFSFLAGPEDETGPACNGWGFILHEWVKSFLDKFLQRSVDA